MLELRNVSKSFCQGHCTVDAVRDVSFALQRGEFCALVGESGSGKSTLSQLLLGLLTPTSGQVLLDGMPLSQRNGQQRRMLYRRVQLVMQDGQSALDPRFSVFDAIAEPIKNLKLLPKTMISARVAELMEQMELPATLLHRKPSELSGGQQKRVCIARALAAEPDYIIFDESVSGLDVIVRKSVLDLLKRLHREQGSGYLFITHDMDVALYLADRVLVMQEGSLVEQVEYHGDLSAFSHPYSNLLLGAMTPAHQEQAS